MVENDVFPSLFLFFSLSLPLLFELVMANFSGEGIIKKRLEKSGVNVSIYWLSIVSSRV